MNLPVNSPAEARVAMLSRLDDACAVGTAVGDAFERVSTWALGIGERPEQAACDLVSAEILDMLTESTQAGHDRVNGHLPPMGEEEFVEWPEDEREAAEALLRQLAGEGCGAERAPAYEFPANVVAALSVARRVGQ